MSRTRRRSGCGWASSPSSGSLARGPITRSRRASNGGTPSTCSPACSASSDPVLVVLDDLHWADDDSLWVLEHLLDRVSDRPLAVIATTRPGSEARAARWHALYRRGDVLALDGLDVAEVAELADQLGATATGAQQLWERTGGNPLFVREQIRTGDAAIPSTVDGVLAAAIERLDAETADVVSLIALAGPATPGEVLAAAAGISLDDLERRIDAARRDDLIRESDGGIRFRHDLLAQAAMRRLDGSRQQARHLALAVAWSDLGGPRSELRRAQHELLAVPAVPPVDAAESAVAVAGQLRSSGQPSDAATLLHLAGTVLGARGDVPAGTKARVAVAEAETRWAIDDIDGAAAAVRAGPRACVRVRRSGVGGGRRGRRPHPSRPVPTRPAPHRAAGGDRRRASRGARRDRPRAPHPPARAAGGVDGVAPRARRGGPRPR